MRTVWCTGMIGGLALGAILLGTGLAAAQDALPSHPDLERLLGQPGTLPTCPRCSAAAAIHGLRGRAAGGPLTRRKTRPQLPAGGAVTGLYRAVPVPVGAGEATRSRSFSSTSRSGERSTWTAARTPRTSPTIRISWAIRWAAGKATCWWSTHRHRRAELARYRRPPAQRGTPLDGALPNRPARTRSSWTVTFDDPVYFTRPWSITRTFTRGKPADRLLAVHVQREQQATWSSSSPIQPNLNYKHVPEPNTGAKPKPKPQ